MQNFKIPSRLPGPRRAISIKPDKKRNKNMPTIEPTSELLKKYPCRFTEADYKKIQDCMNCNPGRTTEELVKLMDFYSFTNENLEIAFRLFNTYKNTFYGVCGPFIYSEGRWWPVYDKKYEESIVLAQENSRLREQISALKEKNTHLKEKQSMQDSEINNKLTSRVSTTSTNLGSE